MASYMCCDEILALFDDIEDDVNRAFEDDLFAYFDPMYSPDLQALLAVVNDGPGVFVDIDACAVPTLPEIINRIHNFGSGMHTWKFTETATPGRSVVNLPAATAKYQAELNGVRLTDSSIDYSISGSVLTLAYPLDAGDVLSVKSYGG